MRIQRTGDSPIPSIIKHKHRLAVLVLLLREGDLLLLDFLLLDLLLASTLALQLGEPGLEPCDLVSVVVVVVVVRGERQRERALLSGLSRSRLGFRSIFGYEMRRQRSAKALNSRDSRRTFDVPAELEQDCAWRGAGQRYGPAEFNRIRRKRTPREVLELERPEWRRRLVDVVE